MKFYYVKFTSNIFNVYSTLKKLIPNLDSFELFDRLLKKKIV